MNCYLGEVVSVEASLLHRFDFPGNSCHHTGCWEDGVQSGGGRHGDILMGKAIVPLLWSSLDQSSLARFL